MSVKRLMDMQIVMGIFDKFSLEKMSSISKD